MTEEKGILHLKKSLKIKVCGMLHPENIEEVCALEPDFLGFIFYSGSKRYVGDKPDPVIFGIPDPVTAKVGVFVNEDISEVRKSFERYHLDLVQLHGNETPDYCRNLDNAGVPVIKVINPYALNSGLNLMDFTEGVRYFLFDTPGKEYGGTGQKFDWDQLEGSAIPLPFLLSGGIDSEDIKSLSEIEHPSLFGIDVNSKFELSPGMKDVGLLEVFFREIRNSV